MSRKSIITFVCLLFCLSIFIQTGVLASEVEIDPDTRQVRIPLVFELDTSIAGAQFSFTFTDGLTYVSYELSEAVMHGNLAEVERDGVTTVAVFGYGNQFSPTNGRLDVGYIVFTCDSDEEQSVTFSEIKLAELIEGGQRSNAEIIESITFTINSTAGGSTEVKIDQESTPSTSYVQETGSDSPPVLKLPETLIGDFNHVPDPSPEPAGDNPAEDDPGVVPDASPPPFDAPPDGAIENTPPVASQPPDVETSANDNGDITASGNPDSFDSWWIIVLITAVAVIAIVLVGMQRMRMMKGAQSKDSGPPAGASADDGTDTQNGTSADDDDAISGETAEIITEDASKTFSEDVERIFDLNADKDSEMQDE